VVLGAAEQRLDRLTNHNPDSATCRLDRARISLGGRLVVDDSELAQQFGDESWRAAYREQ
jgi:hypothetical protein